MFGIIHSELKGYVETRYDLATWEALLEKAGLPGKAYLPGQPYPDSEIVAIVTTACHMTGRSMAEILEDFGTYLTPALVRTYRAFIKPQWRTLDFLEHTEQSIHKAVRIRDRGAEPPALHVSRVSPTEVVIEYSSPRRMCAVARGIAQGVADHYGERVTITDRACMLRGDPSCLISVALKG